MSARVSARERLWLFFLLTAAVVVLLTWRWHNLQVDRFDYYSQLAHENRIKILPVEPPRGVIFDRNGEALAVNETAYSLHVGSDFAGAVLDKLDVLQAAAAIPDSAVKKLVKARDSGVYHGVITLREKLSEKEVANFLSRQFLLDEIVLEAELTRRYPLGDSAGHVIGYVGRINDDDFEKIKSTGRENIYRGAKFIGKTGAELIYETALRGVLGTQEAQVDAHGRIYRRTIRRRPRKGGDMHLTIDTRLQQRAESLLLDEAGAVVLMDVHSGELLALASSPRFDVNHFVFGISTSRWRTLNEMEQKPLVHRAIGGQYSPGSTIKPFLALAALNNGWREEDYVYQSRGFFQLGTHRFHDWKAGGHGNVGISRSIIRSVNTFYYQLGHDIGINALRDGLAPFGFGVASGIDLDNEKSGVLPTPEWKKKTFKQQWLPGETISTSVGQGYFQATPLQMAAAMSMIANGGRRVRPHIHRGRGELKTFTFGDEHLQLVQRALAAVTVPGGTAPRVGRGADYAIAGKTGTAQVAKLQLDASGNRIKNKDLPKKLRDHAWFVGYAPAEAPRVAVAVIVENGGGGGRVAGPIARHILDEYVLRYPLPRHPWADGAEEKDDDV